MTILCNFCLKPSDSCSSVDETQKENLKLIFNNELPITENCLICAECTHKVSSASDIKSACTYNANLMGTYEIDKTGSDKLIDIYLKKNNLKCDFFPNELSICRFCITVVSESNFTLKKDLQDDMNVGEMIKIYFPEVDLGVTKNPILCNKCIKKIQDYEMFVNSIAKNFNSAISNLNNMEKLKVTNIDPQHSDISDTNITNITEEIFTVEGFENEMGENVRNEDFIRDNIEVDDLKDPVQGLLIKTDLSFSDAQLENVICNYEDFKVQVSIEKNENLPSEHEMKHPVEGLLIKTELTSSDVKLGNDVICNYDNFKVQLSVDKNEKALPDPKIEFKGFVLKEEEISIYDVTNHDNSRTFEKDSETLSLVCNDNQGIKQESFQILSSTKQCYHNMSKDTNVNSTSSSRMDNKAAERSRLYRERHREKINQRRRDIRKRQQNLNQINIVSNIQNMDEIEQISQETSNNQLRSYLHAQRQRRYYERHKEEINKRKRDIRLKQKISQSIPATAAERNRKYRERNRQEINKRRRDSRQRQQNPQRIRTEFFFLK